MQSEVFRENAENCAVLAEAASNEPTFLRYKRMEAAWLALAREQDWLMETVQSKCMRCRRCLPDQALAQNPLRRAIEVTSRMPRCGSSNGG